MFQTNSKFPLLDISVTYTYLLYNWREIRIGEFKTKGIVFSHTAHAERWFASFRFAANGVK